ncbi:hypothetical protein [Campylobacter showae]|nr:hypothetical protein [Campylobacter showae]
MGACADLGKIYQNGLEGEVVDYEKALNLTKKPATAVFWRPAQTLV